MLDELNDKKANVEQMAERAIDDHSLIAGLIDGLSEKSEIYRYNCSKVLHIIDEKQPEIIYPYWHALEKLMDSDNAFHRMSSVSHLSYLVAIDTDNKFEKIFGKYFRLLDDQSVIVAIYVAQASGRIALAKPAFQKGITDILLAVDKTHHLPGRRELIKAGIIESFDKYMADYPDKSAIFAFVTMQIESESPKTRNLAKSFIKKWDRREKPNVH
jgi:hypothetical protein